MTSQSLHKKDEENNSEAQEQHLGHIHVWEDERMRKAGKDAME